MDLELSELTTETRTLEEVGQFVEQVKNTDSGMIREWLESLVPGLLGFALQIVLAGAVYLIGSKLIKLARKILRRWLERTEADMGVRQFLDALLKYFSFSILVVIILTLFGVTTASVVAVVGPDARPCAAGKPCQFCGRRVDYAVKAVCGRGLYY